MSMSQMISMARGLVADKKGVTALEYGVIAAIIVVGLVTVLGPVSSGLSTAFTAVGNALTP